MKKLIGRCPQCRVNPLYEGDALCSGCAVANKVKAEKIHLTLTLGEVDQIIAVLRNTLAKTNLRTLPVMRMEAALQKLDSAVNS